MTKEVVKHRKDEKKKPALSAKERKAKKQEKNKVKPNSAEFHVMDMDIEAISFSDSSFEELGSLFSFT